MKLSRSLLALFSASVLAAGVAFAAETATPKANHPPGKPGKCCAKAAKEGHACDHKCCVEAKAAGKNCEKCGGTNPAPAQKS